MISLSCLSDLDQAVGSGTVLPKQEISRKLGTYGMRRVVTDALRCGAVAFLRKNGTLALREEVLKDIRLELIEIDGLARLAHFFLPFEGNQ